MGLTIYIIYAANKKDAYQTARMRRPICVFVVRIYGKTAFLMTWLTNNRLTAVRKDISIFALLSNF